MQEDELYALEDYLDQYQKLVCKYRSENAALRRQLAENGVTAPSTSPRKSNGSPTAPGGPKIDVPPPTDGTTPPAEIDTPDIPPLDVTSKYDSKSRAARSKSRGRVKLAGAQASEDKSSNVRAIAFESVDKSPTAKDVWLHGEVVANETGGGPRMLVEIEPQDAKGQPIEFHGALSLMLMAPNGSGNMESVARWDYRPQDVRSAVVAEGHGKTIRFFLELPANTQTTDGAQLWIQLLQRRVPKVLAHANVILREPSLFSSRKEDAPARIVPAELGTKEAPVVAADSGSVSSEMFDGGWTIAKPGQPGGIVKADKSEETNWRATLEMPPSVTTASTPSKPKPRISRPRKTSEPRSMAKAKPPLRATWSPERAVGTPSDVHQTATRPTWSATR
jgi:hypothetical protein